jgi:hypothetical protein
MMTADHECYLNNELRGVRAWSKNAWLPHLVGVEPNDAWSTIQFRGCNRDIVGCRWVSLLAPGYIAKR